MAVNSVNCNGFNILGNNTSPDQFGHFMRKVFNGNVAGLVVTQNSTPNMTVRVDEGVTILTKNTTSSVWGEVKTPTNVTIQTADTANPRIDTIIIYEDTSVSLPTAKPYLTDGGGGRFKLASVSGTAAASPVATSDASIQSQIGAGKPWARIADVTVVANTTTIINSNIADKRSILLGITPPTRVGYATTGAISTLLPKSFTNYGTITGTTSGNPVEITAMVAISDANSGDARTGHIRVQCDGVSLNDIVWYTPASGSYTVVPYLTSHTPAAGNHTWNLQVMADTGTASAIRMANVTVKEMR